MQLDIISLVTYTNSDWLASVSFSDGQILSTDLPDLLFATLMDKYSSYGGGSSNGNWQHDIFNAVGYRDRISDDLSIYHQLLDDSQNPFADNLNNGTVLDVSMAEYFELYSWYGLEETEAFNNLTPLDLTKYNQIKNQTNQFYNQNCN